jgi:CRP-like cAMP-binding protein
MRVLKNATVDGAIVDIDLHGTRAFPLCEELSRLGIPFFFLTGHEEWVLPPSLENARLVMKPYDRPHLQAALSEIASNRCQEAPSGEPRPDNGLLQSLHEEDWALLKPKLDWVSLAYAQMLEERGRNVSHIYFPIQGAVSIMTGPQGQEMEVALVGREGAIGVTALVGSTLPVGRAMVLFPGRALCMPVQNFAQLLDENRRMHDQFLQYLLAFLQQISATALAAGRATIVQRLARWLLLAADRVGNDKILVTHDTIARLLGVRRSGVTVALHQLEGRQLIRSTRGFVALRDTGGLAQQAASFYGLEAAAGTVQSSR